jgi:DNA transposase THAP9
MPKVLEDLTNRAKRTSEQKVHHGKYTPDERCLALTVQYHSTSAYNALRKIFNNCLPHEETVRRWYKNIDGNPGFTVESHRVLRRLCTTANQNHKKVVVAMTMDEMAVRKHLAYDKHNDKFDGTVDFQHKSKSSDDLASKALVFMLTAVNDSWKIPIGYFYVNGLSAELRAELITKCFEFLKDLDLEVISLTFDGDPANIKAVEILGAKFSADEDMVCRVCKNAGIFYAGTNGTNSCYCRQCRQCRHQKKIFFRYRNSR